MHGALTIIKKNKMDYIKENNAELIEIGDVKLSKSWTNIYLKFRFENKQETWLYYSEHVDKPNRLKQIYYFVDPLMFKLGATMTVNYKIVQSPNKSTKLSIIDLANFKTK